MPFISTNPATGLQFATYDEHTPEEVERRLELADRAFEDWCAVTYGERGNVLRSVARLVRERSADLATIEAMEMGRPITACLSELEKCAKACEYYAEHAEKMLAPYPVQIGGSRAYVRHDPLGPIVAVMPWNFPYWQIVRAMVTALMTGNVMLLKHAANVQGCARAFEELCLAAGMPIGVFQNLAIRASGVEAVLRDPRVKGATVTGGTRAGSAVAAVCGQEIKPVVLELGGNDAFIVLADADLEACVKVAVTARLQNSGQSCIAAKRMIVDSSVAERFVSLLKEEVARTVVMGDPLDKATTFGPLATEEGLAEIDAQVRDSIEAGAVRELGGKRADRPGWYYEPTILSGVTPEMRAGREETFGPVFSVIAVDDEEAAVALANDSEYGLGAAMWTADVAKAEEFATRLNAGFVAINDIVKSDQGAPIGGVGKSGIGREMGLPGLLAFANIKTVRIG